jgi:Putative zinc-finger
MNCETIRDLLDQYVAGTLEPEAARAVRAHLEACADCRQDEAAARFLAPRVAALPRSVPPSRPLWTGIEQRLRPRRVSRTRFWLPLAATVALMTAAGWWASRLLTSRSGASIDQQPSVTAERDSEPVLDYGDLLQTRTYRMAASDLETALLSGKRLLPATSNSIKRDLQTIDVAIKETAAALRADPRNDVLRQLYLSALRRKLEWLRRAVALYAES